MLVTGIAMWAKVYPSNFDKKFNKWTIDLIMDEANATILSEARLKPKEEADGTYTFKFKRDMFRKKDGAPKNPPPVVDASRNPMTALVGNGSLVNIQFTPIAYEKFGGGITHDLQGVQVLKLVSYSAADGEEFDVVDEVPEVDVPLDVPPTNTKAKKGQVNNPF